MKKSLFIQTRKAYNKAKALDLLASVSLIAGITLPFTATLLGISLLWSFALIPLAFVAFLSALEYESQVNANIEAVRNGYGFGLFTCKDFLLKRIIELSK
jgi:hypothetical protein